MVLQNSNNTQASPAPAPSGASVSQESSSNAISIYKGMASTFVMVVGKSGRGKSHSLNSLPPEQTRIITTTTKPFPFMNDVKYIEGVNRFTTTDSTAITRHMKEADKDKSVNFLIIEDAQYIMATEFMAKANEKGFDKWSLMARHFYDVLILCTKLRAGLKVFLLIHEEDDGNYRRVKTLGKLLEDKITPEGLSSIVLFAEAVSKSSNTYYFATQMEGNSTAKSPYEMFPPKIPNDLLLVSKRIDEYYSGVSLKDSKLSFDL